MQDHTDIVQMASTLKSETTSDFEVVATQPRTWLEAFPWLQSKVGKRARIGEEWWDKPIADADHLERHEILLTTASIAIEQLGKWPIGEVFPGLPDDVRLADLELPARASNVLCHEKRVFTSDLVDLHINDLLAFRNAGLGTVTAILSKLADLSTSRPQATICVPDAGPGLVSDPRRWIGELVSDMETLAQWSSSLGHTGRGVLTELPQGAPGAVIDAHNRVLGISAAQVVPRNTLSIANLLDECIKGLEMRSRLVLTTRLFSWEPKTLAELGSELGITRERVRQLEVAARSRLNEFVTEDNLAGRVDAFVRSRIHGVLPLGELLDEVPALQQTVESIHQPVWRVFDVLDESFEIVNGWCTEPSFEAVRRDTNIFLEELADEYGVVRLADVSLPGSDEVHAHPWFRDWLVYLGLEVRDPYVLLRTSSVNDVAAAILAIEGAPLTVEELHAKVDRGSLNSLRNQLFADPAFHRIDLDRWALTSWGLESYSNIRSEIGKLLDQAGGELPLATIVESLVQRFGVSAKSVTVYACATPYRLRDGIVRLQTSPYGGDGKSPAKVRAYYRRGGDWIHRTTVTQDHLRGSGWAASTALATILGMSRGGHAELASRLGKQNFSYHGPQPSYGSIKRFLEDMDLGIGDEIFLEFRGDGSFDLTPLPEQSLEALPEALRLVGADMTLPVTQAIDALGAAIKFSPGTDIDSIAAGYTARGEEHIHDLILAATRA